MSTSTHCPVCAAPLGEEPLLYCHRCATAHHRACWYYNGGCAVFACHGVTATDVERQAPSLAPPRIVDYSSAHLAPLAWSVVAIFFALCGAAIGLLPSAIVSYAAYLTASVTAYLFLRRFVFFHELRFDERDGSIARQLLCCGRPCGDEQSDWVPAFGVRQVVVERTTLLGARRDAICLQLEDRSTRTIYDTMVVAPWFRFDDDELSSTAEAIGRATDAPVVFEIDRGNDERFLQVEESASRLPKGDTCSDSKGSFPRRPVCLACDEVLEAPARRCTSCGATYHESCYEEFRGCLREGCGGKTSVDAMYWSAPTAPCRLYARIEAPDSITYLTIGSALAAMGTVVFESYLPSFLIGLQSLFLVSFFLSGIAIVLVETFLHQRLHIHPAQRELTAALTMFQRQLTGDQPWSIDLEEIVEVHLYRSEDFGQPTESLAIALASGERRLLYRYDLQSDYLSSVLGPQLLADDLVHIAEAIARCADCTVRLFGAQEAPSYEGLVEAATMKVRRLGDAATARLEEQRDNENLS